MLLDPSDRTAATQLHQYYGLVASGSWKEAELVVNLNTVLDAVGAEFPMRRLTQRLIGNIPTTSGVRLQ
jgi:hypothetical protein